MRDDVIAAVICVSELLNNCSVPESERCDIPIFVANGIFIENLTERFSFLNEALAAAISSKDFKDRNEKVYRVVPPLLALRTLTNSTKSFVSQYTGLAGNNGTYGNTSQSAVYALKDAVHLLRSQRTRRVVVGSSNCTGSYSYFSFKNFTDDPDNWKESACSAFLMLETQQGLEERNAKPLCKLDHITDANIIENIFELNDHTPFERLGNPRDTELGIYSGAYALNDHQKEKMCAEKLWKNTLSLYPELGFLGSASVFMNIISGSNSITQNQVKSVSCVNRDVYNRESLIGISKA
jgi:hypothetical protein